MGKLLSNLANPRYGLAAGASIGAVTIGSTEAKAQGVGSLADGIVGQFQGLGNLVVAGAFLLGISLVAVGLLKLKAAADTQGQQVKYGEGLWRLGIGAGLVALPAVTGVSTDTIFGEGGTGGAPDMGTINFTY